MTAEEIVHQNQRFIKTFNSPQEKQNRSRYKKAVIYDPIFIRCSDGRLSQIEKMFGLPYGFSKNFFNIGGKFKVGWKLFGDSLKKEVLKINQNASRKACIIVTYHYSTSDNKNLGCGGFSCDKEHAVRFCENFTKQIKRVFCMDDTKNQYLLVGVCTDTNSLRIHGFNGVYEDVSNLMVLKKEQRLDRLNNLFNDVCSKEFVSFVSYIVEKNIRHINYFEKKKTTSETLIEHNEKGIAFGRYLDWLNSFNKILMIGGAYGDNLAAPVETAVKIILKSIQSNVIKKTDKILLLATGAFDPDDPYSIKIAEEEARVNADSLVKYVFRASPELFDSREFQLVFGVTNQKTKEFTLINYNSEECLKRARRKYEKYKQRHSMML